MKKAQQIFSFLSKPWNDFPTQEPLDAIVVLSNWYDRVSKIRKVLELADAWIERLSSLKFAEFTLFCKSLKYFNNVMFNVF